MKNTKSKICLHRSEANTDCPGETMSPIKIEEEKLKKLKCIGPIMGSMKTNNKESVQSKDEFMDC